MATLDGMVLVGGTPAVMAGAAFRLKGSALEDVTTSPDPNWTVEVRHGSHYVVARSVTPIAAFPTVREAFGRMNGLFLALAEKALGISYGSGGVTYEGFRFMMDGLAPHLSISVAERHLTADLTTGKVDLAGAVVLDLPTAPEPTLDGPFLKSFIGTAVAADLATLPTIGSTLTRHEGNLVSLSMVECTLASGRFATVEAHVGIRLRNARQVKDFFGT
jgi:hypothetical protein